LQSLPSWRRVPGIIFVSSRRFKSRRSSPRRSRSPQSARIEGAYATGTRCWCRQLEHLAAGGCQVSTLLSLVPDLKILVTRVARSPAFRRREYASIRCRRPMPPSSSSIERELCGPTCAPSDVSAICERLADFAALELAAVTVKVLGPVRCCWNGSLAASAADRRHARCARTGNRRSGDDRVEPRLWRAAAAERSIGSRFFQAASRSSGGSRRPTT